ncbi:MAG: hypothetical protein P1U42_05050 [Phycisphaerales bacterium]|nr:hypothetical protein [Phycisphaerales bacterium]
MNTHELIESTMLHALGLLDDSEREAFEAAFAAAPASIQEKVRLEARRMADLGDLIPESEPSSGLRTMVLSAVRAAMREEENEARIAQSTPSPVVGKITPESLPHNNGQLVGAARSTSQPKLSSSPRVHRFWRYATAASVAALIVVSVTTFNMQQTFSQAQSRALVTNLYDTIGAQYLESTIFDANTQRVALTSSESNTSAVAAVWANPDWKTARLFVKNLSNENAEPYRLVVLDAEGNVYREIATFSPNGEFQDFDVDVNLSTERSLAIYPTMSEDIMNAKPVLLSTDDTI